jgi:mRNA interferase MazF
VRRGDVFELRLPRGTGHEQRGRRYGVVVQSDALLPSSVVLVAPTSRSARSASYRPEIRVADESTKVMVEQMAAVDVTRLGELVCHATPHEMWGIDESILTVLSLS